MSILEKLGITPGPWYVNEIGYPDSGIIEEYESVRNDNYTISQLCDLEEHNKNARLIASAPEMLEALIKSEIMDEKLFGGNDYDNQKLIEKATGRTWEEIKELIDGTEN